MKSLKKKETVVELPIKCTWVGDVLLLILNMCTILILESEYLLIKLTKCIVLLKHPITTKRMNSTVWHIKVNNAQMSR